MKKFIFSCLLLCLILPSEVGAIVGNDFTIKTVVGNDSVPPSTPTLLTAEPIAATQIDLSWSASTDNWILGGYVVLRDNVPIATTTLTNYNDAGLTPETLYTYAVYAFDSASNISTTSNSLATTTLAVPVATTTPPTVNQTSGSKPLVLKDLKITTTTNTATLYFETNKPSRYILRWGRTDSYTGGYIENESYRTTQQTTITGLEPGTVYHYELIGFTPSGVALRLRQGQFRTTEELKDHIVANVTRLTATVELDDVRLDYQLPINEPGAKVRILRSHLGFPTDLYDGAIIYEGDRNSFYDRSAFNLSERQYYTVFVIGQDGTISSGAVVIADKTGVKEKENEISGQENQTGTTTTPDIILAQLTLSQIKIIQGDKQQTFFDEGVRLSHLNPFTISIDKEALPDHLKSIVVTILDPTDQRRSYSFLLKINKLGTAYEATVNALNVIGTSRITVEIFDFDQLVVGRYRKQIDFVSLPRADERVVFPDAIVSLFKEIWSALLVLVILPIVWWFFLGRKKKKAEDKE